MNLKTPLLNPAGGEGYLPHVPQRDYLERARRRAEVAKASGHGLQRINYFGGRGCAKTTTGALDMFQVAMECPGHRTFWSAPLAGDIDRVILKELSFIFKHAPETYKVINGQNGYRYIKWFNGHETDLIARQIKNRNAKIALGGNYIGGWHDEPAYGYDQDKMNDVQAAIRDKRGPYRFVSMMGTPLMNGLYTYAHMPGCENFYATSFDNPHILHEDIQSWEASMSKEAWEQEVLGRWIQQGGRIWKHFAEKPWPEGNIVEDLDFDPNRGWILSIDAGPASSALQIIQFYEPVHKGQALFSGKLPVVVSEMVCNDILLSEALEEVIRVYCQGDPDNNAPEYVCIGSDVNHRGLDNDPISKLFVELGWPHRYPKGKLSSKELQRQVCSSLILNQSGERRFAVSAKRDGNGVYQINQQHYGRGKSRGILQVMRNDTFPDPQSHEVFRKDKAQAGVNAIEDDRDAMLYWMILTYPPVWGKTPKRAAA
jgi:hypothetical protein